MLYNQTVFVIKIALSIWRKKFHAWDTFAVLLIILVFNINKFKIIEFAFYVDFNFAVCMENHLFEFDFWT